jgi:hypothetical protein
MTCAIFKGRRGNVAIARGGRLHQRCMANHPCEAIDQASPTSPGQAHLAKLKALISLVRQKPKRCRYTYASRLDS